MKDLCGFIIIIMVINNQIIRPLNAFFQDSYFDSVQIRDVGNENDAINKRS